MLITRDWILNIAHLLENVYDPFSRIWTTRTKRFYAHTLTWINAAFTLKYVVLLKLLSECNKHSYFAW